MRLADIAAKIVVDPTTGCWLYQGYKLRGGYAFGRYNGRKRLLHRVVYEHKVGPIPEGLTIDHLCRVRHCLNPKHMEPVTLRENTMRGLAPSAINARKTHCKSGHPLDVENTYLSYGKRQCKECVRRLGREYRARLKLRVRT